MLEGMHEKAHASAVHAHQYPEQNSPATPDHSRKRWECKKQRQQTRCASSGTHWEWCSKPESLLNPTAAPTHQFESLTPMPRWVKFSNAGPINRQYESEPALTANTLLALGAIFRARTRERGPRNDADYSGTGPRTHGDEQAVATTALPVLGAIFGTRTKDPRSAPGGTFGQTRTPSSSRREARHRGFKDVTGESRERYSGHSGHMAAPPPRPRAAARVESEGTRNRRGREEQKKRVREH